ncbi:MAG: DUF4397 domain-containing protein [Ignavibacteria bacterium]
MKHSYKSKLLLLILPVIVILSGCVDTSGPVIPSSINYSSQMKIVNLVIGSGSTNFVLNGTTFGSANFGEETPAGDFATVNSGSKTLVANFSGGSSKTFQFAAPTEYKFRVFLVGTLTSNESYLVTQRYIWQTKNSVEGDPLFPANKGQLVIFNGSPDATIDAVILNSDTVSFNTPLSLGKSTSYLQFPAGSKNIKVIYNGNQELTFTYDLGSRNRYTLVVYDQAANLKYKVYLDD